MLRRTKAIMIFTVALWGILGVFHNVMDWKGTLAAVGAATSMATLPEGSIGWQATDNALVVWVGALFIALSKLTTGVLCIGGGFGMWKNHKDTAAYSASREVALMGCAVAMIMLFGGFIVIAEGWFELWRSEVMRGPVLLSAFRYGAMITLIGLFVASKD